MAKTVLRNGEGNEITHIYYTTFNGTNLYLTKADNDRMFDFSSKDVDCYYSGEDDEEVLALKVDVAQMLTGDIPMEVIKLNIAKQSGLIKDIVLEVNG